MRFWFVIGLVCVASCEQPAKESTCAEECWGVEITEMMTLGNTFGDEGSQGHTLSVASGTNGKVYAVYNGDAKQVLVHGSDGSVVRVIGRDGRGPGEFVRIFGMHEALDTLYVFDGLGNQVARFDTSGVYLSRTSFSYNPYNTFRLDEGRFFLNARIEGMGSLGHPFHVVDAKGSVTASFGGDPESYTRDQSLIRTVALADSSSVWTANPSAYVLERWSASGVKVQSLAPTRSWFPPRPFVPRIHPDTIPVPVVGGLWQSGDHLWVLIRVPETKWADGLELVQSESGRPVYTIGDATKVYDTVFEVLDRITGELVGSARVDEAYARFLIDGRITRYRQDDLGRLIISVSKVALIEAS